MDHATRRATLQTARLVLRPLTAADEVAVVAALNDIAVTGWLAVVPFPYTPEDFRWFLPRALPGETFAVEDAAGFAGVVGAGAELGYWFVPHVHGQGYATEAALAVLADRFASGGGDMTSGYFEGNTRSARVLAKLGFIEAGQGTRMCRALGRERPHVDLVLTPEAFSAQHPVA